MAKLEAVINAVNVEPVATFIEDIELINRKAQKLMSSGYMGISEAALFEELKTAQDNLQNEMTGMLYPKSKRR